MQYSLTRVGPYVLSLIVYYYGNLLCGFFAVSIILIFIIIVFNIGTAGYFKYLQTNTGSNLWNCLQ